MVISGAVLYWRRASSVDYLCRFDCRSPAINDCKTDTPTDRFSSGVFPCKHAGMDGRHHPGLLDLDTLRTGIH